MRLPSLRFSFVEFPSGFFSAEKKLVEKDQTIAVKTGEINAMEERYVQYLEKAKMVLRQMDPRNSNSLSNQEIQSLKKQLDEKDRRYKELEVSILRIRLEPFLLLLERSREDESHSRRSGETVDQRLVFAGTGSIDAFFLFFTSPLVSREVPTSVENSKNV